MRSEDIDWYKPCELYIFTYGSFIKFGITTNWDRRFKQYEKELSDKPEVIKRVDFDCRWQADLIEGIMQKRLRKFIVVDKYEWVIGVKAGVVIGCYFDTMETISAEFEKFKHIHKEGIHRYQHYKQIAKSHFPQDKILYEN